MPRLMIAATHSGAGKTSVTAGLIAALRQRGMKVAPFKVGPDYIDPGFHALAAGRPSRNLDTWLLPDRALREIFERGSDGAEVAVIEEVMGLFDGAGTRGGRGSTAHLARLLRTPVILVVDAWAQAESVAAQALGFARLDPQVRVVGVIANRVAGPGHAALIRRALRRIPGVPLLGALPRDGRAALPERHLGLLPVAEQPGARAAIGRMAALVYRNLDLDRIVRLARAAPALPRAARRSPPAAGDRVPIAVAMDEAFSFYYQDNLDLLEALGAPIVRFSPLRDRAVPPSAGAIYLGGGFPEVFARPLGRNARMRRDLLARIGAGCPVYAECGGFMYLARSLRDQRGRAHPMVGAIPGETVMTDRLQHFGYAQAQVVRPTLLGRSGERIRGHEFHCSRWVHPAVRSPYRILGGAARGRREGYARGNLLATYLHLHFLSRPDWAGRFVRAARRWRSATMTTG